MGKRGVGFYWKLAFTNLKGNRRVYLPYLLSSVGIIMMFYSISALGQGIDQGALYGGTTVASMMGLGVFVIGLFAVLFLFYTNSFIIKRRKKELGLYNILGMEKRHIAHILFRETLLIAVCSLALGLGLGIVFSRVLFWLLGLLLGTNLAVAFVIPVSAITSTLGLFGIIFLLTLCYNLLQVKLSKPIELLHGGETGEREPKAHWFLAVLGALLLGTGYTMAVTIQDPLSALVFFFVAVILVILGTYLLFITGITAMLKLLKKNKGYYYQTRHFISVSGMIYRMKQNAAGLSVICLLSTAVLVMLSSTVSLYVGLDDVMRNRFKRDYVVTVYDYSDDTAAKTDGIVESVLKDAGETAKGLVSYRYVSFAAVDTGDGYEVREENLADYNSLDYLFFMTLEDYNRISGQNVSLRDDQVMVLADGMRYDRDTFSIFGRRYDVAGLKGQTVEDGMDAMGSVGSLHIVLPNFSQLEEMEKKQAEAYGEAKSRPIYYVAFDAGDGKEGSARLYKDLEERLNGLGLTCRLESAAMERGSFFSLYGGLFFVGLFLGTLFVMATVLIIYYKQISEGYEDKKRFEIMQNVGLSAREIKSAIRSQVLTMFFLPLVTAAVHICFAFPMIARLLALLNLRNVGLFAVSTAGAVLLFAVFYGVIYGVTSKKYYEIVKR